MAIFIFFTLEIIDAKISLRQVNSVTRQSKQGASFTLECVAVLQQMREKTHTHTNHPTIHDVHGGGGVACNVGGGVELSEGWSVKQGAGDQGSDPWTRSSCLHYLCAPALLQLAPRKSQLLHAKMTDGLKQFAVCHQLTRRE